VKHWGNMYYFLGL